MTMTMNEFYLALLVFTAILVFAYSASLIIDPKPITKCKKCNSKDFRHIPDMGWERNDDIRRKTITHVCNKCGWWFWSDVYGNEYYIG